MNKVYGSFAAKAAAFVLMTLFGIAAIFSLIGLDYLAENPDIDRCDSYFESSICRMQLKNAAQDVFREIDTYSEDLDNYLYVWETYQQDWLGDVEFEVRTPDGELVLESMGAFPLEEAGHIHTMTGENYVVKTYVAKDLPFSIGWVNLDKAMFDFCKLFGEWLMLYSALALIGAAGCLLFLLRSSGHRRDVEGVVLNSQDRVPLDVYLICAGLMIAVLVAIADEILASMPLYMIMPLFPVVLAGGYVVGFASLMTIVNRLKYGKFWENTLIWIWGGKALRLCLGLAKKLLRGLTAIVRAVPMLWKGIAVIAAAVLIEFIIFLLGVDGSESEALLLFIIFHAVVIAAALKLLMDMLKLQKEAQALASGELDKKVDTSRMFWELRKHGENLNSIGEGASIAADKQLRSERLKAELITNVSHDIKTPLTSIVNYVDLLKKEKLEGKAAEYVEVLDRQSARLKKLTVDLVDASKASTGNMPVNMQRTNVCEVVRQAAGEYVERLDKEKLELVVNTPQPSLEIMADGRLLWRVIDNLLSNVCKYSMPGTRVYIDVLSSRGEISVAVKNISREMLNIDPDELTERFVRGDRSRNTEGSGLGLNIARSLTELQNGKFVISVDGDLFKAELRFPAL